nr:hypothetical protein [Tanacetum cinerariifolium]
FDEDESDEETRDEESFDPIPQTPENSKYEGNGAEDLSLNQSSSVSSQFVTSMLNPKLDVGMESILETISQLDVQTPTSVAPLPMSAPTMTPSTVATITTTSQAPILPTTVSSNIIQNLANFGSMFRFDNRLRSLEANFSEAMQTNQFAGAVSAIPGIVHQNIDRRMNEAVKVVVQIQSDRLRDEAQRDNDEFLKTVDENMKKIIKEQVKEQVKCIQRFDEQRNLYKALVEAYESDKIILDTYGETVTLKRRRDDDADKDEEPFAGPDRGSKRRREGKEPEGAYADYLLDGRALTSGKPPSLDRAWNKTVPAVHGSIQPWISELTKQAATRFSFNELMDNPLDFSNFLINRLKGRKRQQFYNFGVNRDSARDVYSKRKIIVVTELKIVEWHSYKHLDWITMRRDDDKIYKFKEGDFKRLRIQDIEDMLLLLIQGKNLTVEERFAFNVSLQMFTRRIVTPTKPGRMTKPYSSHRFIANCFNEGNLKMEVKMRNDYGVVVDALIPYKKLTSKRFAFVRFIKVDNIDRLVVKLYTIWIGRFYLHAIVVCFIENVNLLPLTNPLILMRGIQQGEVNLGFEFHRGVIERGLVPNMVTCNKIMKGLCNDKCLDTAHDFLSLMIEMMLLGIDPDLVVYSILVDGLFQVGKLEEGHQVILVALDKDATVYSVLINGLTKQGRIHDAIRFFYQSLSNNSRPGIVTYNTLINGLCKCIRMKDAVKLYIKMGTYNLKPDIVTYIVLIKASIEMGRLPKALILFFQALKRGLSPDCVTYCTLLDGFLKENKVAIGLWILEKMHENGVEHDIDIYNVLVNSLFKSGQVGKASELFRHVQRYGPEHDIVTYNIMISGYCSLRMLNEAVQLYKEAYL